MLRTSQCLPMATPIVRTLACATLSLVVAGCGRGSGTAPPPSGPATTPATAARPRPPVPDAALQNAMKGMAAGVPIGEGAAPLEARFDLKEVPTPGVPFTVGVAVIPGAAAPVLRLEVTGAEGLLVLAPTQQETREKIPAGAVVPLEVQAQSAASGTRVLYVRTTLELPDGPQTRTFAFPVLVGPAAEAPKPAAGGKPPPR